MKRATPSYSSLEINGFFVAVRRDGGKKREFPPEGRRVHLVTRVTIGRDPDETKSSAIGVTGAALDHVPTSV